MQVEDLEMKMQRQADELKVVKLANETYQKKIAAIYDNNIIIAKERSSEDPAAEAQQSDPLLHIQEEVRALHYQIQQKDEMINQMKHLVSKRNKV